jgi:glycosyltransferase involved in cell wall biosynthesis
MNRTNLWFYGAYNAFTFSLQSNSLKTVTPAKPIISDSRKAVQACHEDQVIEGTMKLLFLEPFYGGSHRDFARGLCDHSAHDITLVTLPARFWKWRMRGAALHFARTMPPPQEFDGVITTDLMSLSDLKMLTGSRLPPALVYFHENQITYPLAQGETRDVQFGFTDITTALAADRILFNSHTHFNEFFTALPGFLKMMPEFHPLWVIDAIREKTGILHPGCRFTPGAPALIEPDTEPPLIIWNHRWEFDKNPVDFFTALATALARGHDFRLALLGENFQKVPKPFIMAKEQLGDRIVCYGFEKSRHAYRQWLRRGALVISTAHQENFGISMVEAIRHGCLPLLPARLAYPEILPPAFHDQFLYQDQRDLEEKLVGLLADYQAFRAHRKPLAAAMEAYAWEHMAPRYDQELADLTVKAV